MDGDSDMQRGTFDLFLAKEDFKFNCAHFVAYRGFRERLHGHNYLVSVRLKGRGGDDDGLGHDGYVADFGEVKRVMRMLCKKLNETFICPCRSNVIQISDDDQGQVQLRCEDGAFFSLPKADCTMLPIVHSTCEELARYIWCQFVSECTVQWFGERNVRAVEVTISETHNQGACYGSPVPQSTDELDSMKRALYEKPSRPHPCSNELGASSKRPKF